MEESLLHPQDTDNGAVSTCDHTAAEGQDHIPLCTESQCLRLRLPLAPPCLGSQGLLHLDPAAPVLALPSAPALLPSASEENLLLSGGACLFLRRRIASLNPVQAR